MINPLLLKINLTNGERELGSQALTCCPMLLHVPNAPDLHFSTHTCELTDCYQVIEALPDGALFVGSSSLALQDVRRFNEEQPQLYRLNQNDCR